MTSYVEPVEPGDVCINMVGPWDHSHYMPMVLTVVKEEPDKTIRYKGLAFSYIAPMTGFFDDDLITMSANPRTRESLELLFQKGHVSTCRFLKDSQSNTIDVRTHYSRLALLTYLDLVPHPTMWRANSSRRLDLSTYFLAAAKRAEKRNEPISCDCSQLS